MLQYHKCTDYYQHTVVFASVGCSRLCAALHWSMNVFSIFFFLSVPLVALIFSSSEHKSKKGTCSATSLEELLEAILQPTIDVKLVHIIISARALN